MNKKPIKICYLITGLNTGGAEKQLDRIVTNLNKEKFEPVIISMMDKGEIGKEIEEKGIKIYTLCMARRKLDFGAINKLKKIIKYENPIIICSFMYHANMVAKVIGNLCRIPVIINSVRTTNFGGRSREILSRYTDFLTDKIIINSNFSLKILEDGNIIKRNKAKVIPNGINTETYGISDAGRSSERQKFNINNESYVWLAVGRFHEAKNYPSLIKSFANILKEHPDTCLVIAGGGSDELKKRCEDLAIELNIGENIKFLGIVKDISTLHNIADSYILSSSWEGMSNALMEAITAGLPVVSTKVGGASELIDEGGNGFLVEPDSLEELTEAMLNMMSLSKDEKDKMGQLGRKNIQKNYDIKYIVKQWESLYINLIDKKGIMEHKVYK